MTGFLKDAGETSQLLECMHKNMTNCYKECAKYFAFDPQKYMPDEMFGDLKAFRDQFEVRHTVFVYTLRFTMASSFYTT